MAFPNAKKKVAALIVAGMPGPDKIKKSGPVMDEEDIADGGADDAEEEGGQEAAEESTLAELFDAQKTGDLKAGVAAFKEFLEHCGYSKTE